MSRDHFIQSLEPRRLMSAVIIDEPISDYAGLSEKVRLAYLPTLRVAHLSQLSASIDWGDGSADTPASFARDKKGGIDVLGTHDYVSPGTFSVSAVLTERPFSKPGQPAPQYVLNLGQISTTATVTQPQLTETATQKFTAVIASFHQPTVDVIFTAKINWGDGTTSVGTITGDGSANGNWQVTGTHMYKKTGVYKVHTYVYSRIVSFKGPGSLFLNLLTLIHVMGAA
jgi:hypothetical protein